MASPLELQALIDQGWALVPVRAGTKRPDAPDWPTRTFTPDDFRPDDNVGVKLGSASGGLVDVDCDCRETAALAHELLPVTRMHGRPSHPHSHYWYRIIEGPAPESTAVWKDLQNSTLIEVRSTGGQTVVPPSIHASGEPITWANPRQAVLPITIDALTDAVRLIATGALLAQHWPEGRRHEAAGHVGGMLARFGIDPAMIERLVRAAARLAGDEEAEDRARFARESAEKHARGERTTGAPSLKEMFGEAGAPIVGRIALWYHQEETDQIEQMNERHFVVQLGASMVVGTEPQRPGDAVDFQKFEDFDKKYFNRYLGKKKLGKAWLEHPQRRTYDRVVFAPPCSNVYVGPDDYNIWRGFVCEPAEVSDPATLIPRYLDHIYHVICSGDDTKYEYVLDLLADCVQRPGDPPGKALVLRSQQGLGKALALSTPIPTPHGLATMADLSVGDAVLDEEGQPCTVVGKTVPHVDPLGTYKLTFDDGTEIVCGGAHEWYTETLSDRWARRRGSVKTTVEIAATALHVRGTFVARNHAVPVTPAWDTETIDLPIDPYVLGAWLGDGTSGSGQITKPAPEMWARIEAAGYTLGDPVSGDWQKSTRTVKGLLLDLRAAGLLGNKHIPDVYFAASADQRLALLQGLLDTDGHCSPEGTVEFCSTIRSLADGVRRLAASLGIKPSSVKASRARLYGKDCGPRYRVTWTSTVPVFSLPRKRERLPVALRPTQRYRYIRSVTPVAPTLVQCIQVDSPSHLYLCGEVGIPTHNSVFVEAFGGLWGRHFLSINNRNQLTGAFNAHLSGRIVVFPDDAVWGGHKEDIGTLKHLTTQRQFLITRKHVDSSIESNFMHLFLATNESWAWPAGNRERRAVILDLFVERPRAYFDALVAEIQSPTFRPALLAFLQARTVDLTRLRAGLDTAALREQQELTADPVQQWWKQVLDDGAWKGERWPEWITTDALYEQFTEEMGSIRGAGASHRGTRMSVVKRVHAMLPARGTSIQGRLVRENLYEGIRGMAPEWVEKRRRVLVLPSLGECRRAYDLYTGLTHEWPAPIDDPEQLAMEEL